MEAPEMEKNKMQGVLGSLWHVQHPKHRSSVRQGRAQRAGGLFWEGGAEKGTCRGRWLCGDAGGQGRGGRESGVPVKWQIT